MITSIWLKPGDDTEQVAELRKQCSEVPDEDMLDRYAWHLILLSNDVPVATGRLQYERPDYARIWGACVVPKYRKQGIGDGLIKVLDYKAAMLGIGHTLVTTPEEHVRFFERIGYRRNGKTEEKNGQKYYEMEKETNDGSGENCAHQCSR